MTLLQLWDLCPDALRFHGVPGAFENQLVYSNALLELEDDDALSSPCSGQLDLFCGGRSEPICSSLSLVAWSFVHVTSGKCGARLSCWWSFVFWRGTFSFIFSIYIIYSICIFVWLFICFCFKRLSLLSLCIIHLK